jgi:hypothetical protein
LPAFKVRNIGFSRKTFYTLCAIKIDSELLFLDMKILFNTTLVSSGFTVQLCATLQSNHKQKATLDALLDFKIDLAR